MTRGLGVTTRGLVLIHHSEGHDVAALSGVDLTVTPGETVGLIGPSGAGKSTLLALFAGLLRPSAGFVTVGGQELSRLSEPELDRYRATRVGLMLQGAERNLIRSMTPRQNVAFAQRPARRAGVAVPRVAEVLELVGLTEQADRELDGLSPGTLQLAAVAATISSFPGLLLCDEPTSRLEHAARDRVIGSLAQISATVGSTVVVVTHDPAVAAQLPRTVTIRDGRIGGEGRPDGDYSVVAPDGSLALPAAALADLPPGTLVQVRLVDGAWRLTADDAGGLAVAADAAGRPR